MQAKDDYDHAVFVHTAKGERAFVMDPLGRGRYQGQWVTKADLRQYASRFSTASGSPYCGVVRRSQASSVERLSQEMRERTPDLRAELVTAKSAITTTRAQALRDAARAIAAMSPRRRSARQRKCCRRRSWVKRVDAAQRLVGCPSPKIEGAGVSNGDSCWQPYWAAGASGTAGRSPAKMSPANSNASVPVSGVVTRTAVRPSYPPLP
jgi:hypothetical protein